MYKLFIYNALKKDFYSHSDFLNGAKYISKAITTKGYSLYIDTVPFLVVEVQGLGVIGELYEVSDDTIKALDHLEGHPDMFERKEIDITLQNGEKLKAWAYIYPNVFKDQEETKKGLVF